MIESAEEVYPNYASVNFPVWAPILYAKKTTVLIRAPHTAHDLLALLTPRDMIKHAKGV
jgi:hypothetical protein